MPNDVLHQLRLNRGWTKEELARQAKVSAQTVRKAERGGRISEVNMAKIAKALQVRPNKLFPEDDDS
jgi:transcriptional regulator with XRE-family HTH domain